MISQWVNSVPPYIRKLHYMYEVVCTSSKGHWSIYHTSKKRRGTLQVMHKLEGSSPTLDMNCIPMAAFYFQTTSLVLSSRWCLFHNNQLPLLQAYVFPCGNSLFRVKIMQEDSILCKLRCPTTAEANVKKSNGDGVIFKFIFLQAEYGLYNF